MDADEYYKLWEAWTDSLIVEEHFCVYGDATPMPDANATYIWPKQVLVRKGLERPDAWLVLEGIVVSGICVAGLSKRGRILRWLDVSSNPKPESEGGNWGSWIRTGGKARWVKVKRRTAWARLLS
jgi:hypothetical protein